jgi:hypothetical protein
MISPTSTIKLAVIVLTLACTTMALAQGPPGPPAPSTGSSESLSGTISQLNYGPEMEVTSFLLNGNTLVTFPPRVGWALSSILKAGVSVQVTGLSSATASGRQRIELQTLNTGGRTVTLPEPGQFTSYNTSGKVVQLNYNREGEVDGFLLSNGVFAKTPPPVRAGLGATVSVGSQISIAGYSHETISGRTVVDVQSINGQALT